MHTGTKKYHVFLFGTDYDLYIMFNNELYRLNPVVYHWTNNHLMASFCSMAILKLFFAAS